MFGSAILDIAIGLVFVYLLVSLAVTAANELIAASLGWRAQNLRKGVERLLNSELAGKFYDHPLIQKLSKIGRWPSYIPSRAFALALVDVIADLPSPASPAATDVRGLIQKVPDADVRKVLGLLAEDAGQDLQKLKQSIEDWFNASMDRVAGWYKRKAQVVNVVLAIVLAGAANVDTVLVVRSLSNDSALRAALVAQAQELAKEGPATQPGGQQGGGTGPAVDALEERIKTLARLGVPVGWSDVAGEDFRRWPGWVPGDRGGAAWVALWFDTVHYHFLGWVLTALAASLGAPFWFDMLNKIITIRSTGRVPEGQTKRSKEEPKL